jgi:hypothetical protein
MLTVGSNKNVVTISVDTGKGKYSIYNFRTAIGSGENDDALAELLAEHIDDQIQKTCIAIRRQAYEQGWAEAKAKRTKTKIFSCQLRITSQAGW